MLIHCWHWDLPHSKGLPPSTNGRGIFKNTEAALRDIIDRSRGLIDISAVCRFKCPCKGPTVFQKIPRHPSSSACDRGGSVMCYCYCFCGFRERQHRTTIAVGPPPPHRHMYVCCTTVAHRTVAYRTPPSLWLCLCVCSRWTHDYNGNFALSECCTRPTDRLYSCVDRPDHLDRRYESMRGV